MKDLRQFLFANEEAIESIPTLVERSGTLEDALGLGSARIDNLFAEYQSDTVNDQDQDSVADDGFDQDELVFDQGDHDELFAEVGASEQTFDQRDHDELFTAGGATKQSFDPDDWGELFQVPIAADPTLTHPDI